MQVRLEAVEDGEARVGLGQQLVEALGSEEATHRVPLQVQLTRDPVDRVPGIAQLLDDPVPLAGADDQAALVDRWSGDVGGDRGRISLGHGFSEASVMAGDRLLDRLAKVVPQVPAISHLDRVGCPSGGALRVGASSIPTDHLYAGVLLQPVAEGLRLPVGE